MEHLKKSMGQQQKKIILREEREKKKRLMTSEILNLIKEGE